MHLIVVVDQNWGIGKENDLLFYIKPDKQFFRANTLGKAVIMGRKTLQSLPGGKPFAGRDNIVLTRNPAFAAEGAVVCHDMAQLRAALAPYAPDDVFVTGGAEVYAQLLDYCSDALVTKVQADGQAEKFFPNLDEAPNWTLAETGDWQEFEGLRFAFCRYVNTAPKAF